MKKKKSKEPEASNALSQFRLTNEQRAQILKGLPQLAQGALDGLIKNGLSGAIGFPGGGGIGFPGSPYSEQLSDTTTLFKNLRWYLVSNFRQLLSEAYVELGLIQTICRVPVDDALRGGVEIKSKQLSEDQVQELQVSLDRDDDLNTAGLACVWKRLYGGAGIVILTDQDPETPFQMDLITPDSPLEFRAVDMWELFWDQQNTDGYDPEIQTENFETYNYYAVKLHKSRVMRLKGLTAPSFIRPRLRGWGFSVVEALVRSINQYLKATDLSFEVLDEFKLDIFKMKNLVNTLLSPNGEQLVRQRVQLANWQKNYQNAMVMDSEDDFGQKQLSFSGLAETMGQIRMQVAADMRMPVSKLFGSQGGGLNSDDETDLEVYNAMVEAEVRGKIKYDILRMCEIKCQKLFGFVPDDLSLEFAPLRVLGAVDEEKVKDSKFTRAHTAATTGLITAEEFRDICNRDELLGVQLMEENMDLLASGDEIQEGEQGPDTDSDDPGADRADTRKPRVEDDSRVKREGSAEEPLENAYPVDRYGEILPYSLMEKAVRLLNSPEFDRASYEADGGGSQIDDRRAHFFEKPTDVDSALWEKAKKAGVSALGREDWKFTAWMYKKLGGKSVYLNQGEGMYFKNNAGEWDESKHKRAADGKFGSGGGSGKGKGPSPIGKSKEGSWAKIDKKQRNLALEIADGFVDNLDMSTMKTKKDVLDAVSEHMGNEAWGEEAKEEFFSDDDFRAAVEERVIEVVKQAKKEKKKQPKQTPKQKKAAAAAENIEIEHGIFLSSLQDSDVEKIEKDLTAFLKSGIDPENSVDSDPGVVRLNNYYGIDVKDYDRDVLKLMRDDITAFRKLGVSTDDLED